MSIYMPTADPSQLTQLRADIHQLTHPIAVPVRQRIPIRGRRITQWVVLDQDPLLDQLRQAADGQNSTIRGPERRQVPRSRPPLNLDAHGALAALYVALSGWHVGLQLPSPPRDVDWHKHALQQLSDDARRREPRTVEALAADVHHWWRQAATHSGWSPTELVTLRNRG